MESKAVVKIIDAQQPIIVPWYLLIPSGGTPKLGCSTIGDPLPPPNLAPFSKAALAGQIKFHMPPTSGTPKSAP